MSGFRKYLYTDYDYLRVLCGEGKTTSVVFVYIFHKKWSFTDFVADLRSPILNFSSQHSSETAEGLGVSVVCYFIPKTYLLHSKWFPLPSAVCYNFAES